MEKCINGNDLIVVINDRAVGHCSTHTCNISTETKDRAFKPKAELASATESLFTEKVVTGVSAQVSADAFVFTDEEEFGYPDLLAIILAGQTVKLKLYQRKSGIDGTDAAGSDKPYLSGQFIISSLNLTAPAKDDATYTVQADNSGPLTIPSVDKIFTEAS